jgi:hypothetical protein
MILGLRRSSYSKGFKTFKSFKPFKPLPLVLPRDAGEDARAYPGLEPGEGLNVLNRTHIILFHCSWSM